MVRAILRVIVVLRLMQVRRKTRPSLYFSWICFVYYLIYIIY